MSGPLIITDHGIRVTGLNREPRDDGDDDCEAFDPTPNTGQFAHVRRTCRTDGHYRCVECALMAPPLEEGETHGY